MTIQSFSKQTLQSKSLVMMVTSSDDTNFAVAGENTNTTSLGASIYGGSGDDSIYFANGQAGKLFIKLKLVTIPSLLLPARMSFTPVRVTT